VLADFRDWLSALAAQSEAPPPDEGNAEPDLYALLKQFTALRHEVNLQTKAARAQQDQNGASLAQLTRALDALQQAQAGATREGEQRLRPLLITLVELYDALSVADREARRVQETVLSALQEDARPSAPPVPAPACWLLPPAYRRAEAARRQRDQVRDAQRREDRARVRQLLASLTTGYAMSLQRVERALKQHGLEPILATGQPFDPERMEAVEAVAGSDVPPARVINEVLRGYLWNGRVFRFAKVRVAK
jgi:molecular chaperone GrpE